MMHPGVLITGLVLLLTGMCAAAVDSYRGVQGVVGRPVTLPCTYNVSNGISVMCWSRGECPSSICLEPLIWTDGYSVYYWKNSRYQLKGQIPQGNVSLTIEHALESDSGFYCCRMENERLSSTEVLTFLLQVNPESPTSPSTKPTTTMRPTTTMSPMTAVRPTITMRPLSTMRPTTTVRATTTVRPMTTMRPTSTLRPVTTARATYTPVSAKVSASTPLTPAHMQTSKPDWNGTVTLSSDEPWNNHTEVILTQKPQTAPTKGFVIGVSTAVLVLLILMSALAVAKYIHTKRKTCSLSLAAFHISKIGALQNAAVVGPRVEDQVYIIEDSLYAMD